MWCQASLIALCFLGRYDMIRINADLIEIHPAQLCNTRPFALQNVLSKRHIMQKN